MKKKLIKLTENDLHRIINESVKKVLAEDFLGGYNDDTIPNDLRIIYRHTRSLYNSALDELRKNNYLSSATLGELQDKVNKLYSVIMKRGRNNCPVNLLKLFEGMKDILNKYSTRQQYFY